MTNLMRVNLSENCSAMVSTAGKAVCYTISRFFSELCYLSLQYVKHRLQAKQIMFNF